MRSDSWDWTNPAVYNKIRQELGDDAQIIQTIQELAELTQSLTRYQLVDIKKHDYFEVIEECVEELADAQLMIYQMMDLFGRDLVENEMREKLYRLRNRMIADGKETSLKSDFPRGGSEFEDPSVCPICDSPRFKVTSIQGGIATCQCLHCFNAFILPGQWAFKDESDSVRVRKKERE